MRPRPKKRIVEEGKRVQKTVPPPPLGNAAADHQRLDDALPGAGGKQGDLAQQHDVEGDSAYHLPCRVEALGDEQILGPESRERRHLLETDVPELVAVTQVVSEQHLLACIHPLAVLLHPHEQVFLQGLRFVFRPSPGYDHLDLLRRVLPAPHLQCRRTDDESPHPARVQCVGQLAGMCHPAVDDLGAHADGRAVHVEIVQFQLRSRGLREVPGRRDRKGQLDRPRSGRPRAVHRSRELDLGGSHGGSDRHSDCERNQPETVQGGPTSP